MMCWTYLLVCLSTTLAAPSPIFTETIVFPRATSGNVTTINAGANAVGKGQGAQFIGGKSTVPPPAPRL